MANNDVGTAAGLGFLLEEAKLMELSMSGPIAESPGDTKLFRARAINPKVASTKESAPAAKYSLFTFPFDLYVDKQLDSIPQAK